MNRMDSVHTSELFASHDALLARAEVDSIEALFRQHALYVATIALRVLGSNDAVDDVVQDTFVIALKQVKTLRDPQAVRAWLATTAVRLATRKLRRRRLRQFLWARENVAVVPTSIAATSEQRVLLTQAYRILDRLPVDERVAWLLRYVEDAKLEDIASWCGCSLATAKRRIAAAQTALDEEMQ